MRNNHNPPDTGGGGGSGWVSLPDVVVSHFDAKVVAISALVSLAVYMLGRVLLPLSAVYRSWNKDDQYHARGLVPSTIFILVIVPMAIYALIFDANLRQHRVVGSTQYSRLIIHIAAGYFAYDSGIVILHIKHDGFQLLAHGVLCLITYLVAAMYDCYHYYGPTFLMFEFTTIFVNFRWLLSQLEMKGHFLYFLNGLFLLIAWSTVRIIFGVGMSYFFWTDTMSQRTEIPTAILLWYTFSNICLNTLNVLWFLKILKGIKSHYTKRKLAK